MNPANRADAFYIGGRPVHSFLCHDKNLRHSHYVQLIESELEHMRYVINQTLARYRDIANRTSVSVTNILDLVLLLCKGKIAAKNIQVEKRYEHDGTMMAYSEDLRQAFCNLVVNAIYALQPSGKLIVHVRRSRKWSEAVVEGVHVVIADNGAGIPPEHQRKVLRQSFTTKGRKGSGVGLTLTAGIISEHGGNIRFRSRTTKGRSGTVFSVFLPAAGRVQPAPSNDGFAPAGKPPNTPRENRAIARRLRAENERLLSQIRAHHKRFNLATSKPISQNATDGRMWCMSLLRYFSAVSP